MDLRPWPAHGVALHVIGQSPEKIWRCGDLRQAWRHFAKIITLAQDRYLITTRAFVMMSNHYHWLCECPTDTDLLLFQDFHHLLHDELGLALVPKIFILNHWVSYRNAYKYICRNPRSAQMVFRAEDYPYSTLHYVLGAKEKPFPFEDNMNVIYDPFRMLNWINSDHESFQYSTKTAREM